MNVDSSFVRSRKNTISIFVCSFLLSFVFVSSSRAQSEVYTKWTARFDAAHTEDDPAAMALDGKGNTFVTGNTCIDNPCTNVESLTIGYNSNGNVKWRAFLSGTSHLAIGLDIAVDSAGNVYVLSFLNPTDGSTELATAKYSPAGVRQWVNFIASTSNTGYRPMKLAVAPGGNVYVTITAQPITNPPSETIPSAVTVKYDTTGKQIWSREAALAGSPAFVRLDAAENVYVLVFNYFDPQNRHSVIFKYNANGTLLNSYGGNRLGNIKAFRVDGNGNSYVAGSGTSQPPNGIQDRIVAKFSSAGVLDWLHDFGPAVSGDQSDFADLAVDSSGDVLVAQSLSGTIPLSGGTDISVVKFNSTGTVQWTTHYNGQSDDSGNDQPVAIAVNSSGYTYITGFNIYQVSSQPAKEDFVTVKYDPNGKQIWAAHYNANNAPVALALSGGDVVVAGDAGFNSPTSGSDWLTIDYVQDAAKVSPTSLSFGNQKVGTVSASKTVTLTNTAEVPLAITGISITGEFELTNNCPSTVAAGATCTFTVKFAPTQLGGLAGTVTVHDNWSGSAVHPQTVQLTGTGTT
jgi:hypothetical protein